jgi:hypothetical protein
LRSKDLFSKCSAKHIRLAMGYIYFTELLLHLAAEDSSLEMMTYGYLVQVCDASKAK